MTFLLLAVLCTTAQSEWQLINTKTTPPARSVAAMSQIKNGILMFGGATKGPGTWKFSEGDWHDMSQLGDTAPSSRVEGAMAPFEDGAVLFGGLSLTAPKGHGTMNDTWIWTPAGGWRQALVSHSPPGRYYHSLVQVSGAVLLFGGTDRADEAHDRAFGDTWIFDGQAWRELTLKPPFAPTPRWGHSMICNEKAFLPGLTKTGEMGGCVLFGGAGLSEDDHYADTWMFTSGVWKEYQPGRSNVDPLPTGRWSFQMAACGQGALMLGGSTGYRIEQNDTWTFNFTYFPSVWSTSSVNHDAWGEWSRQRKTGQVLPPLGGMMMARIDDGNMQGVVNFGGLAITGAGKNSFAIVNTTTFWPDASCPSTELSPVIV